MFVVSSLLLLVIWYYCGHFMIGLIRPGRYHNNKLLLTIFCYPVFHFRPWELLIATKNSQLLSKKAKGYLGPFFLAIQILIEHMQTDYFLIMTSRPQGRSGWEVINFYCEVARYTNSNTL